jgi:hypothetical protein
MFAACRSSDCGFRRAHDLLLLIRLLPRNSLVLESSAKTAIGRPFPLDTLMDYFTNGSLRWRKAVVTTQFWTPTEFDHMIPSRFHSNRSMEPAVVKIVAAPICDISGQLQFAPRSDDLNRFIRE